MTKLLRTIEAWAPNPTTQEKVWHYDLTYETSHGSGASLLTQVERCGALGGCLPAKQFGWQSTTGAQWDEIPLPASSLPPNTAPIVLDLDGDGRDDVVYAHENSLIYVLSTLDPSKPLLHEGSVMAQGGFAAFDGKTARPIDLDGDGRDEIVVPGTFRASTTSSRSRPRSRSSTPPSRRGTSRPPASTRAARCPCTSRTSTATACPTWSGALRVSTTGGWSLQLNAGAFAFKPAVSIGDRTSMPLTTADGVPTSFAADQGDHRATLYLGVATTALGSSLIVGLLLDTQGHPGPASPPCRAVRRPRRIRCRSRRSRT